MTYHPKPSGPSPNGKMNGSPPGKPEEGAALAKADNLDMNSHQDQRMFMAAVRRWKIKPEFRDKAVKALEYALGVSVQREDAPRIIGAVRTLATLESQNQNDEHLQVNLTAKAAGIDDLTVRVVYEDAPDPLIE